MRKRTWKESEENRLSQLVEKGRPWADIKTEFYGRSIASLQRKWDKLKKESRKHTGNGQEAKFYKINPKACNITAEVQEPRTLTVIENNKIVKYVEQF